jgi:hypothetical protein
MTTTHLDLNSVDTNRIEQHASRRISAVFLICANLRNLWIHFLLSGLPRPPISQISADSELRAVNLVTPDSDPRREPEASLPTDYRLPTSDYCFSIHVELPAIFKNAKCVGLTHILPKHNLSPRKPHRGTHARHKWFLSPV